MFEQKVWTSWQSFAVGLELWIKEWVAREMRPDRSALSHTGGGLSNMLERKYETMVQIQDNLSAF